MVLSAVILVGANSVRPRAIAKVNWPEGPREAGLGHNRPYGGDGSAIMVFRTAGGRPYGGDGSAVDFNVRFGRICIWRAIANRPYSLTMYIPFTYI